MANCDLETLSVTLGIEERLRWQLRAPRLFEVACVLGRYAPRGRGWIARFIGRHLCPDAQFAIRTAWGAFLAVDPSDLDYYTSIVGHGGELDPGVGGACISLLRPGEVFYVYRTMVGRHQGRSRLYVPTSGYHASSVPREASAVPMECPIETLDAAVQAGLPVPHVIKIDVEGGELDVLRGAQRVLRDHSPALVFESDANMKRFGYQRSDLLSTLSARADYQYFAVLDRGLAPLEDGEATEGSRDVVAVPPHMMDRVAGEVRAFATAP
jgi:methyltransferase FkbM-like protein